MTKSRGTPERPDYRTRAGREQEVLAQIRIEGGFDISWVFESRYRACAIERLQKTGRIRALGGFPFTRFAIVGPAAPRLSVLERIRRVLIGGVAV